MGQIGPRFDLGHKLSLLDDLVVKIGQTLVLSQNYWFSFEIIAPEYKFLATPMSVMYSFLFCLLLSLASTLK